jgi:hypothetical protein
MHGEKGTGKKDPGVPSNKIDFISHVYNNLIIIMSTKSHLELQYAPHSRNYTMYLDTSSRLSGAIRGVMPNLFNKDDEFDLSQDPWGRLQLELKNDIQKLKNCAFGKNLDDNDLQRFYELEGITDPWSLKGFFTKGKGLGYPYLAKAIYEDQDAYLMDTICGIAGHEMVCLIKATKKVGFVEQYLAEHNKAKPKIVRIIISSQVPKDTIAIYPYRKNEFKYIPSYYRNDKGVTRLPAIIDFPSKYVKFTPQKSDNPHVPTREDMEQAAEKLCGKGKTSVEKYGNDNSETSN